MAKKNVLIVDDSEFVRKIVYAALENDYRVFEAENGLEATEKLYSEEIALIICDVIMPIMDGFEFVKKIKTDDNLKKIPIVMLTTESYDYTKQNFEELGVNDYLVKPVNSDKLNKIVKGIIG